MDFVAMLQDLGVPLAMLVYFVYRDSKRDDEEAKREEGLTLRLRCVEDYQRDRLEQIITSSHEALVSASTAMRDSSEAHRASAEAMSRLVQTMATRPCIADELGKPR